MQTFLFDVSKSYTTVCMHIGIWVCVENYKISLFNIIIMKQEDNNECIFSIIPEKNGYTKFIFNKIL